MTTFYDDWDDLSNNEKIACETDERRTQRLDMRYFRWPTYVTGNKKWEREELILDRIEHEEIMLRKDWERYEKIQNIPDESIDVEEHCRKVILAENIKALLQFVTPRERKIIEMRYGLVDGVSCTLEEVGKEFGVTRERIKQIQEKVLQKLREHPASIRIREYPKREKKRSRRGIQFTTLVFCDPMQNSNFRIPKKSMNVGSCTIKKKREFTPEEIALQERIKRERQLAKEWKSALREIRLEARSRYLHLKNELFLQAKKEEEERRGAPYKKLCRDIRVQFTDIYRCEIALRACLSREYQAILNWQYGITEKKITKKQILQRLKERNSNWTKKQFDEAMVDIHKRLRFYFERSGSILLSY